MSHSVKITSCKPKTKMSMSQNQKEKLNANSPESYNLSNSPCGNKHIPEMERDYLYHFNIDTSLDFKSIFGNVNVVITGGEDSRIAKLASKMHNLYKIEEPLIEYSNGAGRYLFYCIDNVLLFNHGIGSGSASIAFHEVFKLLYYAQVNKKNVNFIRIGTCGGVNVEPGTCCLTKEVFTETFESEFSFVECGKKFPFPMI